MKTYNIHFSETSFNELDFSIINSAKSILVQVFSGVCKASYLEDVVSLILYHIPEAIIIGATTDGEIKDGNVSTNKIVVSISTFEKTTLKQYTNVGINKENSLLYGQKLAKSLHKSTKALIVFSDGLHTDGDAFLEGVASVNPEVVLAGGMAGDNMAFKETFVLCNSGVLKQGVVAVILEGEDLIVNTDYTLNLMSIGNELKITHTIKNRVYTINNQKADEIYRHYLGEEVYQALPQTGFEFPLICTKEDIQVTRSVIARHENGSLEFAGNIQTGEYYHLSFASVNMLLRDIDKILQPYEEKPVESLFISCMVRRNFFEEMSVV